MRDMAAGFAAERMAPHAVDWDQDKLFPVDVMREAAAARHGRHLCSRGFRRLGADAARCGADLRGVGDGLPDDRGLHLIHNMAAWMIDAFGNDAQRRNGCRAVHHGIAGELLPDRAGLRFGRGGAAHPRGARRRPYVLDGEKQFISGAGKGDLYVVMVRTGKTGPAASRRCGRGRYAGTLVRRERSKMGWNAQPTRAVIFEKARVPVANGSATRASASRSPWRASTAAG